MHPNILTLISFFFSVLFFVFVYSHLYLFAVLSSFGFIFDALDGYVARKKNIASPFGAFLDSTLDRVSDFLVISSFGYAGIARWEIVVPALLTAFLVSYARARGQRLGVDLKMGFFQRPERLLSIILALVFYMLFSRLEFVSFNVVEVFLLIITFFNFLTFTWRVNAIRGSHFVREGLF